MKTHGYTGTPEFRAYHSMYTIFSRLAQGHDGARAIIPSRRYRRKQHGLLVEEG